MEQLFFKTWEFDQLPDGRQLFEIILKDRVDKEYAWAPKWQDFCLCFKLAYVTETRNAGVVIAKTLQKLDEDIRPFLSAVEVVQRWKPADFFSPELQQRLEALLPEKRQITEKAQQEGKE